MDFSDEELAKLLTDFKEAFAKNYPILVQMGGLELEHGWFKKPSTEAFFAGFMLYAIHLRNSISDAAIDRFHAGALDTIAAAERGEKIGFVRIDGGETCD